MGLIIILAILGPFITWSGLHLMKKANHILKWPQIEVTLIKKGAKYTDKPGGSRSARHEIDVTYNFDFDGVKHTNTSYSFVTTLYPEEKAISKAENLPDIMKAYVNPNDPNESFLVAPSLIFAYIITGLGISFLVGLTVLIIQAQF